MVVGRFLQGNDSCHVHFGQLIVFSQLLRSRRPKLAVFCPQVMGFLGGEDACFIFEDGQIDIQVLIFELPDQCLGRGILNI